MENHQHKLRSGTSAVIWLSWPPIEKPVCTLVPIWFPHCPAWMWTISLIFLLSVAFFSPLVAAGLCGSLLGLSLLRCGTSVCVCQRARAAGFIASSSHARSRDHALRGPVCPTQHKIPVPQKYYYYYYYTVTHSVCLHEAHWRKYTLYFKLPAGTSSTQTAVPPLYTLIHMYYLQCSAQFLLVFVYMVKHFYFLRIHIQFFSKLLVWSLLNLLFLNSAFFRVTLFCWFQMMQTASLHWSSL